jgi:hypothetical protein
MKKFSFLGILAFCFLLAFVVNVSAQRADSGVSVKESVVPASQAPVRIVSYGFGQNGGFLRNLTIEVQNVSVKPVYFFRYVMLLRVPTTGQPTPAYQFMYNPELQKAAEVQSVALGGAKVAPLLPNETVKLQLPESMYLGLLGLLKTKHSLSESGLRQIDFSLQTVYYGDGTSWAIVNEYDKNRLVSKTQGSQGGTQAEVVGGQKVGPLVATKVSFPVPIAASGCPTCSGPCGNWQLVGSCLRYSGVCQMDVIDYQYERIGNGYVRPTVAEQPCGSNEYSYLICVIESCQL